MHGNLEQTPPWRRAPAQSSSDANPLYNNGKSALMSSRVLKNPRHRGFFSTLLVCEPLRRVVDVPEMLAVVR